MAPPGDSRKGIAGAGLACHAYVAYLVYNAGYGEWKDGARAEQVRKSIQDTTAANSANSDAAFQYCLSRYPRWGQTCHGKVDEADIYRRLQEHGGCWQTDLRRVSPSKYFVLRTRYVEHERADWPERLYGWLVTAADLGILDGWKAAASGPVEPKPGAFAAGKRDALKIKSGNKGLVKTALRFYSSPESREHEEIIATFSGPLHSWHGKQQKARSSPEIFVWALGQCDGSYYTHIQQTLKLIHSPAILYPCGLEELSSCDNRSPGDCQCVFQDAAAAHCGLLATSLAASRLRWGMDFLEGYPKRSILLCQQPTQTPKESVVEHFLRHADVVRRASAEERPAELRAWAARSHMLLTPVLQLSYVLGAGALTDEVRNFSLTRNVVLRMSQCVEEGNKYQMARIRKAPNKRVADIGAYEALLDSNVLHNEHRFTKLDSSAALVPRNSKLAEDAFRPDWLTVWPDLRGIKGPQYSAPWHSPGANHQNGTIGELFAMEQLLSMPSPPTAKAIRKCVVATDLLRASGLIVSDNNGENWWYVLGELSDACFMGWPVIHRRYSTDGSPFFLFDAEPNSRWRPLTICDVDAWKFWDVSFRSPQHQSLQHPGAWECEGGNNVIRLLPRREEPLSALELSAKRGFWILPRSWALEFASLYEHEIDTSSGLFDVLWSLVQAILGTSDDDTLAILAERAAAPVQKDLHQLQKLEEAVKELGRDESREYKKELERACRAADDVKDFKVCFRAKRDTLRAARAKAAAAKAKAVAKARGRGRGRGRGLVADPLYEEKVYANVLKHVPKEGAITQAELSALCPPGGTIWNNWKGARWCGHYAQNARFSLPWADGGHRESGLECVRLLWRQHMDADPLATGDCPVEGLFPKE